MVKPFAALRPKPDLARQVCELPYDVMSEEEARQMAEGNPLSFLRVSRAEIEFAVETDPYGVEVYARARDNFQTLIGRGTLVQDPEPAFYLYRQVMGQHAQVGLVAVASCEEYLQGMVRKHEHTRPAKEDDRVRHIESLDAQTGPAFLVYRVVPEMAHLMGRVTAEVPETDFVAADGVRHSAWGIRDDTVIRRIESIFAGCPQLYIADGHHRTAAAARVYQARNGEGQSGRFLAVLFAEDQVQILPYHRVLRDLNGMTTAELLKGLSGVGELVSGGGSYRARQREVGCFVGGHWHGLHLGRGGGASEDPAALAEQLDVAVLQRRVLAPLFGIDDPRTSERIAFVGGIRGVEELERLVRSGEFACAFALHPTSIAELLAVADRGGIMPPKSTWFEPKLRDGMFTHLL